MELKLNSYEIYELGETISKKLFENGVTNKSELIITVSKEELKKIDEDLFYRCNKEDNDKKEFIPSEGEINVDFKNLLIKIKEKGGK